MSGSRSSVTGMTMSGTSCPASSSVAPEMIRAKNGSEKRRLLLAHTTAATARTRFAVVARAARRRTYPRWVTASRTCSRARMLTPAELLSTREAVASETPASCATWASVGESGSLSSSPAGRGRYCRSKWSSGSPNNRVHLVGTLWKRSHGHSVVHRFELVNAPLRLGVQKPAYRCIGDSSISTSSSRCSPRSDHTNFYRRRGCDRANGRRRSTHL